MVLHDVFAVPFDTIAPIVGRSSTATRQLASRARRRVRGAATTPDTDLARQRAVVDAFLAAAHGGDFEALLAVLDPDVVLRGDRDLAAHGRLDGSARRAGRGRGGARGFARLALSAQPALVNGAAGVVSWRPDGQPFSVLAFTVVRGKIVAIDAISHPARLRQLDLTALHD